jgi:hypothetical protein
MPICRCTWQDQEKELLHPPATRPPSIPELQLKKTREGLLTTKKEEKSNTYPIVAQCYCGLYAQFPVLRAGRGLVVRRQRAIIFAMVCIPYWVLLRGGSSDYYG